MQIKIKKLQEEHILILRKMNGQKVGFIPYKSIESLKRGIKTVSELTFSVSKYHGADKKLNPLYDELKNEREILLDEDEIFIIKKIVKKSNDVKVVTAYAKEKKMFKNTFELDDFSLTLKTPYETIRDCFSLDELLYEDTGWHLGYISDSVLYEAQDETSLDIFNNIEPNLSTDEKLRYQESISTNWYDFINEEISEQFECYPVFDSYNKLVHLYKESELGEQLGLLLSYDNYLKELEEESDTEDIVTRLKLLGNDDLTILENNPSGYDYIEDYSYFIDNREMSDELIKALEDYNAVVKERSVRWFDCKKNKANKEAELQENKNELFAVLAQMKATTSIMQSTKDEVYKAKLQEQLNGFNDRNAELRIIISELSEDIVGLTRLMEEINKQCKKEYATYGEDESDINFGKRIISDELLNELKEFVYKDTYSNDNIIDENVLLKMGKKYLKQNCQPTKTWSVDSQDFMSRIIDNEFRKHWNGELGLGDIVLLKDNDDTIIPVYLIGYTKSFKNGSERLQLEFSNKKEQNDFTLSIGEKLTMAKESYEMIKNSQSSVNKIKRNTLGLRYDKINKTIL